MDNLRLFTDKSIEESQKVRLGLYEIRKKNQFVLKFVLYESKVGIVSCDVVDVGLALMPIGLSYDGDQILKWLDRRFIPKNRAFVNQTLDRLPGNRRLHKLLEYTFAMSLNDDYWIVSESNLGARWEDFNLYSNSFSKDISLVAFTGHGDNKFRGFVSSPEFTTHGMLRKAWRRIGEEIHLYKGGTEGYSNAGMEPYSEFFASQVAKAMGLNCVDYDLKVWKGVLCSTCKLFTSEDVSLVTFASGVGDARLDNFIWKSKGKIRYDLISILVFDSIILNEDRHKNNFGFMVDNRDHSVISVAPIYDNGFSLLVHLHKDDLKDYEKYIREHSYTFLFNSADDLQFVKAVMDRDHRAMVRKLIGFELKQHSRYKVPDDRLKLLNKVIQERVKLLLQ